MKGGRKVNLGQARVMICVVPILGLLEGSGSKGTSLRGGVGARELVKGHIYEGSE